ncbi:MAG: cell wall hydrolase [Pseudomonadota bacterium]
MNRTSILNHADQLSAFLRHRMAGRVWPASWPRRAAILAAPVALCAMAAPGDFGALPASAADPGAVISTDMATSDILPFEQPGMSFPGSAFYYLADPPSAVLLTLPSVDPLTSVAGTGAGQTLGARIDAGPPARPFFSAGIGPAHSRALDCLAQAIWYEAASETDAGQRAVAQVVLNRTRHASWPGSVCGVVFEGSERRTGCQFSFTCDGSLARRAAGPSWQRARRIAAKALSGSVYAPIGHATHYHTLWVNPYWASRLDHVGTIGAHRFYRQPGANGTRGAFEARYAGREPVVPKSGLSTRAATSRNTAHGEPNALAIAQTSGVSPGSVAAGPAASETLNAPAARLPQAGQIKPDFIGAGQWKSLPTAEPQPAIE